jgi:hypothetical protein
MYRPVIIGEKGNLSASVARRRARKLARVMGLVSPADVWELSIDGYDDDPRELWDIPEARDYFVTFADMLLAEGADFDRLLLQSREVIDCCRAAQAGRPVALKGTREDTIRDGVEQVLAQMREGKRKIH